VEKMIRIFVPEVKEEFLLTVSYVGLLR